jgi:arylsulfatase A-like enzyme
MAGPAVASHDAPSRPLPGTAPHAGRKRVPFRAVVVIASACCALIAGCTRSAPPAGDPARPDVVFITLDTTRADHVGAYGYERPTTPVLDELAREGLLFRRAWSTSSWTLPSHASMFTGQYPTTHGADYADDGESMFGNKVRRLGAGATTLAELLSAKGYATAAFAGGPWLAPEFGLLQGYEKQHAGLPDGRSLIAPDPAQKGQMRVRVNWAADQLTDLAVEWLRSVPSTQPVHLLVNYFDPHVPYQYRESFEVTDRPDPKDKKASEQAMYDSEIRFMDHHIGRLFDALRELGRFDRALIVAVADHGESFGEHGNSYHGPWLYEEIMRVPLIVKLPESRERGSVVETAFSVVDLLPLIGKETGLELPAGVEGVPLGSRDTVVAEAFESEALNSLAPGVYERDVFAGIRWPWKILVEEPGSVELFNLEADPAESEDRAGKGEAVEDDLRRALSEVRGKMAPPAEPAVPKGVDPAVQESLRALGYIP